MVSTSGMPSLARNGGGRQEVHETSYPGHTPSGVDGRWPWHRDPATPCTALPPPTLVTRSDEKEVECRGWELSPGDEVEYYSSTQQKAVVAQVQRLIKEDGVVVAADLDCKRRAKLSQIKRLDKKEGIEKKEVEKNVVKEPKAPKFNVGQEVSYKSASHGVVMDAIVEKVREDGFFDLDVKKGARPENIIFPRVEATNGGKGRAPRKSEAPVRSVVATSPPIGQPVPAESRASPAVPTDGAGEVPPVQRARASPSKKEGQPVPVESRTSPAVPTGGAGEVPPVQRARASPSKKEGQPVPAESRTSPAVPTGGAGEVPPVQSTRASPCKKEDLPPKLPSPPTPSPPAGEVPGFGVTPKTGADSWSAASASRFPSISMTSVTNGSPDASPIAGSSVASSATTLYRNLPANMLFLGTGTENVTRRKPKRGGDSVFISGPLAGGEINFTDAFDAADPEVRAQLLSLLGFSAKSKIERMTGFSGGLNDGVWFLSGSFGENESEYEELVLKLVRCYRIAPNVPTEAENLVKVHEEHPGIGKDESIAFPIKIFSCLDGSAKKHDLIVMRKIPGERLAEVICRKFYNNQLSLLRNIFTKLGVALSEFHERYGKQHGDFQPSNVFYDDATDALYLIDIGGMGLPTLDTDVEHFREAMQLLAGAYSPTLHEELAEAFEKGYSPL